MAQEKEVVAVADIMKKETILPPDFDGVFRFTNNSDEEFIGKWNGKEYVFPANATSPMIMPEYTPYEIQNIRKKFAKDYAEKKFARSVQYMKLMAQERNPDGTPRLNSMQQAGTYSLNDLAPYIQECLKPLPISKVIVKESEEVKLEKVLTRNSKGKLNTKAIATDEDLEDLAKGKE